MIIKCVYAVVGFVAIHWLSADQLIFDDGLHGAITADEADVVDHMNTDHSDALLLYATRLLGHTGENWVMTGIDLEGIDLGRKRNFARLDFDYLVID